MPQFYLNPYGPVQLNIEELDSETWHFDKNVNLPNVRTIRRYGMHDKLSVDLSGKRVMILIGEHRPFKEYDVKAIEDFCQNHNAVVYADHISNYHGEYTINGNQVAAPLSQTLFNQEYLPDVVLTLGGLTGDYGIYNLLIQAPPEKVEHWRINRDGDVVDTYGKLTKIFEMEFSDFHDNVVETEINPVHTYYEELANLQDSCDLSVELPFSNMYVAQQLHTKIPNNSIMHYAILNSFRVWNLFPLDKSIHCFSNVAAFGIDGCMSAMIGQSVIAKDSLVFHITGDLSFFYDMNSLGIRHINNNVRIILVNNNGGMTFKYGDLQYHTEVGDYIAGDNHFKNAKGWAETCGFKYFAATNKEDFAKIEDVFCQPSNVPILIEAFVKEDDERKAEQIFFDKNRIQTSVEKGKSYLKQTIKKVAGGQAISMVKQILGKG